MPGFDPRAAIVLLWGLTALLLAWTLIPAFIAAFGGTRYAIVGSNSTQGMEPAAGEPDYSFWAEQLLALGYEPLGSGRLRIHFAGPIWAHNSSVRVFHHPRKQCFAFMEKAPSPYHFWPGAMFATCWADGRFLLTDNNRDANPHPDDEFIRQGLVTLNLADVEAMHLATMEVFRRSGAKPDGDLSIDALLHAMERHSGPEIRRHFSREGTQYLFVHGLIHVCVSTPAAYIAGIGHWSVPVANLVLGFVLLLGESSQKRQYAQAVRSALKLRQSLPVEKRGEMEM